MLGVTSGDRVKLDFDSTYIRSCSSRRQGADPTWTKRYTLHPLLCFVAELGTCLHAKLRRGKANTSSGITHFVDECLRRAPGARGPRSLRRRLLFQGPLCHARGQRCGLSLRGHAYTSPDKRHQADPRLLLGPCMDKKEGEVAEFGYRMGDDLIFRRYVAKRIPVNIGEQMELGTGSYHHWVLVTNDHASHSATLESEHRHKAQVEPGRESSRRTSASTC